jgi:predicted GNAT family acetyltransferase
VDGEIVGNVSLRRSRDRGGYLIGNVVVHPEHRGQGIGGALMRRAIQVASRRGVPWVGLEVRADNEVARTMYEGLSFYEVGRTHHMIRDARRSRVDNPDVQMGIRRGGPGDADAVIRLMERVIPEEQRPLLERTTDDYQPGLARRIDHWLRCEDEVWWVVPGDDGIHGATRAVKKTGELPHRLEVLVAPGKEEALGPGLTRRGLAKLSGSKRPITSRVPGTADGLVPVLRGEGFREVRVLVQMKRDLKRGVPVGRHG